MKSFVWEAIEKTTDVRESTDNGCNPKQNYNSLYALQSYSSFASQPQQQGDNSVHAYDRQSKQRHSA